MILAGYLLALAAVVAGWFRPFLGFCLLLLLLGFTRELDTGLLLRRLAPFDLALAGLTLTWLWREWRRHGAGEAVRRTAERLDIYLPVVLFLVLAALRLPWVPHLPASAIEAIVYAELIVVAVFCGAQSEEQPARAYRALVLSMALVAGCSVYDYTASQLGWPTLWPEYYRIRGPFKNPNQAGSYFAMGLPLALGALSVPRNVGLPAWGLLLVAGVQAVALVVTFSRTSLAAGVGGVLLFCGLTLAAGRRQGSFERRLRWQQWLAPLILLGLMAGLIAAYPPIRDTVLWKARAAIATLFQPGPGGADGHPDFAQSLIGSAWGQWSARPLLGVGLGNFAFLDTEGGEEGYEVHGAYLSVLTETGLIGAALIAAFLVIIALRLWRALTADGGPLAPLLAGAMAALGALLATGVWNNFLRKRHFWVLVALALVLAAAQTARRRRPPLAPTGAGLPPPPVDDAPPMAVQAVDDLETAMQAVIAAGLPVRNPYLTPAWLRAWHRHFGAGEKVRVLLAYRGDELMGYGAFSHRALLWLREYRFLCHRLGNYLEPVAWPGCESAVAAALVGWFQQQQTPVAVLFHDLNSATAAAQAMVAAVTQCGGPVDRYRLYTCPHMQISPDWEAVLRSHATGKRRKKLRRAEEMLSALGEPQYQLWRHPEEAPQLLALLPKLRAVHRARFQGVLNPRRRDDFWDFLSDLIPDALGTSLEILTLHVQGRLVGFAMGAPMADWYVAHMTAFDPAFSALSPGHLMDMWLMRDAGQRGFRVFDFSKGDNEYKQRWQDGATYNEALVLWVRPGLAGSVLRRMRHYATAARLWVRRRGYTAWLRTLPSWPAALANRLRFRVGWPLRRGANAAGRTPAALPTAPPPGVTFTAPVLPAISTLPPPVQQAMIAWLARNPGPWRVAISPTEHRAWLVRGAGPVHIIAWGRREQGGQDAPAGPKPD